MIFHAPNLALLLGSLLSGLVMLWAALFAVRVVRRWDVTSGSAVQIALEKRTYLVTTLVKFVLVLETVSLVFFVLNADAMAPLFTGAMCAVGTLNNNQFGFPALLAKLAVFFAAFVWLAVNRADETGRDYPLTRQKYALLLGIAPLVVTAGLLQYAYFAGIRTDIITSCCSRLFVPEGKGVEAELASLAPLPALALLGGGFAVITLLALRCSKAVGARERDSRRNNGEPPQSPLTPVPSSPSPVRSGPSPVKSSPSPTPSPRWGEGFKTLRQFLSAPSSMGTGRGALLTSLNFIRAGRGALLSAVSSVRRGWGALLFTLSPWGRGQGEGDAAEVKFGVAPAWALTYGLAAAAFFLVALAAIISVISSYVYEQPHHHCPFCLLKGEHDYIGFALYLPLFGATGFGLAAGLLAAFGTPSSLAGQYEAMIARHITRSAALFALFMAVALFAIARSHLVLLG